MMGRTLAIPIYKALLCFVINMAKVIIIHFKRNKRNLTFLSFCRNENCEGSLISAEYCKEK